MKPEKALLQDVVCEDPDFAACDAASRQAALGAFRRRVRLRLLGRVSALAAGILVCSSYWLWLEPKESSSAPRIVSAPEISPVAEPAPPVPEESTLTRVSDAELLAAFPPGSCFLAEIDGKNMLVFRDPELRARYVR